MCFITICLRGIQRLSALSKHHYVFSQRYTISLTGLARQRSLISGSVPEEYTCVFQQ